MGSDLGPSGTRYCTFSEGAYAGASNKEDDIAILTRLLGPRPDDHSAQPVTATALRYSAPDSVSAMLNTGIIETDGDRDLFAFRTTGGDVRLEILPLALWNNLHVRSRLLDSLGNLVLAGEPLDNGGFVPQASLLEAFLPAGRYLVEVTNTGYDDGQGGVYTTYGSLGQYDLRGWVTGSDNGGPTLDIALTGNTRGFQLFCGSLVPEIEVANYGTETLREFQVELLVDDTLVHSETLATQLAFGGKARFTLPALRGYGENRTLTIRLAAPNGAEDASPVDNSRSLPFTLLPGEKRLFTIDANSLDSLHFAADFRDGTGSSIQQLSAADLVAREGHPDQLAAEFCTISTCLDLVAIRPFHALECPYADWQQGSTHVAGDIVAYQGVLYEAKWWNTQTPTAASWNRLGPCPVGDPGGSFTFGSPEGFWLQVTNDSLGSGDYAGQVCADHEVISDYSSAVVRSSMVASSSSITSSSSSSITSSSSAVVGIRVDRSPMGPGTLRVGEGWLEFAGSAEAELYTLLGQRVGFRPAVAGSAIQRWDLTGVEPGRYLVRVRSSAGRETRSLLVR